MSRRSVYTNTTVRASLVPVARTATANGTGVDRRVANNMHRSAMVVISTGAITDGTHTIEVQDSDDNATFAAVADQFLQGSEPAIGSTDDNTLFFVGYIGPRRYLRVVSTVAGATGGGIYAAVVVLGEPGGPTSHAL